MKHKNLYILGSGITSCRIVIACQGCFQTNKIAGSGDFIQVFQERLMIVSNKNHKVKLQFSTMLAWSWKQEDIVLVKDRNVKDSWNNE